MHHKILWSIKMQPNPPNISGPPGAFGSKLSLMVLTPINLFFDAHDNEVNVDGDFPSMFENAQTNQDVDLSSLQDAITNVIERWGLDWR